MCVRLEQMKKKDLIKLIKRMRKSHEEELKKYKPEPREFWINIYQSGVGFDCFNSEQQADAISTDGRTECIQVREVTA